MTQEAATRLLLVGNPNVGKSVIFSSLSGQYVTVSNYPGTTVEVTRGYDGGGREIVDTPGVNSLIPRSEDERVARDILLEDGKRVIVQVADAKNLRRALMLSSQLAETGLPFVLDVNMQDEAGQAGIAVDSARLSGILGVPVVETVAVQRQGLQQLRESLDRAAPSRFEVRYDAHIRQAVSKVETLLPPLPVSRRGAALMLLAGDEDLKTWLEPIAGPAVLAEIEAIKQDLQARYSEPVSYIISKQRAEAVERAVREVSLARRVRASSVSEKLGRWSMHPVYGTPVLLSVLLFLYFFVGKLGAGISVDFLESVVFEEYLSPWAAQFFDLIPIPLLQDLFVGKYGLITVGLTYAIAIVLPIMTFFFLAFGVLEDTGYLPRLAVMANKLFKVMGLSGKAVLPMVLGLGCATMATLTTRILESRRERVIATLLLALGVPCSAQLAVILAMLSALSAKAAVIFVLVIASQLLLVGFLASRLMPGQPSDFIVEIPPFRIPHLSNILMKTRFRVEWFLKEAVPLFLLGTLILFTIDKIGVLLALQRLASPVVETWLGLPADATGSFILGFLRRDYGAAGLFRLAEEGLMDGTQTLVSLVVMTLFVPCIANFFVMIKERGLRAAIYIVAFIFPFAVLVGGTVNLVLKGVGWRE
ncbi:MAG: ferrous iron transport protein B [Chloroflexi bacterium]|nr:ferrous iron transport protein B [Chloroflexota bacterium]